MEFIKAEGPLTLEKFFEIQNKNQEENIRVFQKEWNLLNELNTIFLELIEKTKSKELTSESELIIYCFLFSHKCFLFSASCFLKGNLSECFCIARRAIDFCLTSYELDSDKKSKIEYLQKKSKYNVIRKYLKKQLDNGKIRPSLKLEITKLIHLHGVFSEYTSHADFSSFGNILSLSEEEQTKIEFSYFEKPISEQWFQRNTVFLIYVYTLILRVFKNLFDKTYVIINPDLESKIKLFEKKLSIETKKYNLPF